MIIVLPFSTAYSLIIQPNISYAATEPAEYPAGPVLPFFTVFLALTVNFAVCKPLDFIGENPEAPPVADKARDLSEQIQRDATRR